MRKPDFLVALFVMPFLAAGHVGEPPAPEGQVAINFALPEMDGTISLGIYDEKKKLVRVLHREAPESVFVKGLNGLITYWDGKDSAGKEVAAGNFTARGCVVGEVGFEGEAYHLNDWFADADSLRIRRIVDLIAMPNDTLYMEAEVAGGERRAVMRDREGALAPAEQMAVSEAPADAPERIDDSTDGAGNVWVIEKKNEEVAVKQFSPAGEFLRRLAIKTGDPAPRRISVAPDADTIYLLEDDASLQRVRKLSLEAPASAEGEAPVSKWRSSILGEIRFSENIGQVRERLITAAEKQFEAAPTVRVALVANPLKQEEKPTADIAVAVEKEGSFIHLADGLPLRRVSETPGLKWAVIGREGDTGPVTIFQSDGAVVEEFTARGLENVISFDAGDFEFPPPKAGAATERAED